MSESNECLYLLTHHDYNDDGERGDVHIVGYSCSVVYLKAYAEDKADCNAWDKVVNEDGLESYRASTIFGFWFIEPIIELTDY